MSLRKIKESLHPFYTDAEIDNATHYYVPTQCQNVAPSKEDEPGRTHAFATKELLIPFFLDKVFKAQQSANDKFFIVLADSGMGKTTFMINLYIQYLQKNPTKVGYVRLLPLGYPEVMKEVEKIPENKRADTMLMLDAFDEDNEALTNYRERLQSILNIAGSFGRVIITCRTQFFPSEEEEPKETGIISFSGLQKQYLFRKLYVSPFDERDIKKYLSLKYPLFQFARKEKAAKVISQSPNLMVRPMLLSYIDDLIENVKLYKFAYQVYEELIKRWVEREVARVKQDPENYRRELMNFSKAVSIEIYLGQKKRGGLVITGEELLPFAKRHGIALNDLELKSRSLLNRDAKGNFKFSHRSILEYFLAFEAFSNPNFYNEIDLTGMEQAAKFLSEMLFDQLRAVKGKYKLDKDGDSKDFTQIMLNEVPDVKYVALKSANFEELKVLRAFKNLDRIQIGNIQLKKSMLDEILGQNLLNLSRKFLLDVGALQELTHIAQADLSYNQIEDCSHIQAFVNLQGLNLRSNKVLKLSGIEKLSNLISLDLSDNRIISIQEIESLARLESLDLSGNQIEDISALKNLSNLKWLNLKKTKVRSLEALKGLTNLANLDITNTPVSPEDAAQLQQILPNCKIEF